MMTFNARGRVADLFVLATYAALYITVFFSGYDPRYYPLLDNLEYHFPNFLYFANTLANYGDLPYWYPDTGGIPPVVTSVSLLPFFPSRLMGYALFLSTHINPLTIYKVSLTATVIFFCWVWFKFSSAILKNRYAGFISGATLLMGGVGLTAWHQEQMLATIFWYPFVLLCLLKFYFEKKNGYLFGATFLFGLSLNYHYPFIYLWTFLLIGGCALYFFRQPFTGFIKSVPKNPLPILGGFIAFILGAGPIIYIYFSKHLFASPVRATDNLAAASFEEYLAINVQQNSSASLHYLSNLAVPASMELRDAHIYYITAVGMVFLVLGIFKRDRMRDFLIVLFLFLAWASLGTKGYFAQMLFLLKIPTVDFFRQWYHFSAVSLLPLSLLIGKGFLNLQLKIKPPFASRAPSLALCAGFILLAGFQTYWLYPDYHRSEPTDKKVALRLNQMELAQEMSNKRWMQNRLGMVRPETLIAYKDSLELRNACRITEKRVLFIPSLPGEETRSLLPKLCKDPRRIGIVDKQNLTITPFGLEMRLSERDGVYIVPFSPRAGFDLNNISSHMQKFPGFFLITRNGNFQLPLKRPIYYYLLLAQLVFLFGWCLYTVFPVNKRQKNFRGS